MLLRLLRLLSSPSGVATTRDVARELDVGEGLLMKMLEDAVRLGYLAPLGGGCEAVPCGACQMRGACQGASPSRLWSLTAKGRRLLGETPDPR